MCRKVASCDTMQEVVSRRSFTRYRPRHWSTPLPNSAVLVSVSTAPAASTFRRDDLEMNQLTVTTTVSSGEDAATTRRSQQSSPRISSSPGWRRRSKEVSVKEELESWSWIWWIDTITDLVYRWLYGPRDPLSNDSKLAIIVKIPFVSVSRGPGIKEKGWVTEVVPILVVKWVDLN